MTYRPDIDGLRAVSIISVLLFHFEIAAFSGGFVGVDIFFVISGFLIGSIIINESRAGTFSLRNFYDRRIRRIFPALFLVVFVCAAYCFFFYLPDQFTAFGSSILYASIFLSNLFFLKDGTNYFVDNFDVKPLLHTWSLSIEEQFYLLFPLIVIALFRMKDARRRDGLLLCTVIALCLLSFTASVSLSTSKPMAAFFATHSRVWELMLGVLLAVGRVPVPKDTVLRQLLGVVGAALIVASVLLLTRETPYPGFYALGPCVGAALLILAGAGGTHMFGALLASPPFVFVGKISYSLYLWHWPIYTIFSYHAMRAPTVLESAVLVIASFLVSALSWRFVEQPFRKRAVAPKPRHAYLFGGAATATGACIGAVIIATQGLPGRIDPEILRIGTRDNHVHEFRHCHSRSLAELREGRICTIGDRSKEPSFVIWGDSHADMHVPALDEAARRAGKSGLVTTKGGCPPLNGVRKAWIADDPRSCEAYNDEVVRMIMRSGSIRNVIMAGFWKRQVAGFKGRFFTDAQSTEVSAEETKRVFKRAMVRQIDALAGKKIYIVADVPYVGHELPLVIARSLLLTGKLPDIALSVERDAYVQDQHMAFAALRELSEEKSVEIVRLDDVLCPDGVCEFIREGKILYKDHDHLSKIGSMLLVDKFHALLQ